MLRWANGFAGSASSSWGEIINTHTTYLQIIVSLSASTRRAVIIEHLASDKRSYFGVIGSMMEGRGCLVKLNCEIWPYTNIHRESY